MSRFVYAALFVVAILLAITSTPAQSANLSPREAANTLSASVVHLVRNGSDRCTAFKVAPATYLTARHCAKRDVSRDFLRVGSRYRFVEQYIASNEPKDDWAIVKTGYNDPLIPKLNIGCDEEVYLGMPVAYAGYPIPLGLTVATGYIISIEPTPKMLSRNSEYATNTRANIGASGSPFISLDTGNVIGILTQLIGTKNNPKYATGIESIKNTSLCREVATTTSDYQ